MLVEVGVSVSVELLLLTAVGGIVLLLETLLGEGVIIDDACVGATVEVERVGEAVTILFVDGGKLI